MIGVKDVIHGKWDQIPKSTMSHGAFWIALLHFFLCAFCHAESLSGIVRTILGSCEERGNIRSERFHGLLTRILKSLLVCIPNVFWKCKNKKSCGRDSESQNSKFGTSGHTVRTRLEHCCEVLTSLHVLKNVLGISTSYSTKYSCQHTCEIRLRSVLEQTVLGQTAAFCVG